jgi:ATP-dependent DNA helicase RecQ
MPPKGEKRVTTKTASVKARRVITKAKAKPESGGSIGKAPKVLRAQSGAKPVEVAKPTRGRRVAKAAAAAPPRSATGVTKPARGRAPARVAQPVPRRSTAAAVAPVAPPESAQDCGAVSECAAPAAPPPAPLQFSAADIGAAARRLGIEQLRAEQQQVISALLDGRDVLMILPTGFGKSACYQIPSLLLPKPVLVVSPLLALLRDQHEKLIRHDVPCVRLDGTVLGRARDAAIERIARGGSLLVMTTPESLERPELQSALAKSGVALAAVDEAHCISEWGHDFRPSYLRLGASIEALRASTRLALTATATSRVREAIVRVLRMQDPAVVASSPHRSNLAFEVLPCQADDRLRAVVRLVQRLRRPGIVYCATKREVDLLYGVLQRFKVPVARYHGGMSASERNAEQEGYMRPYRRTVMVATSAFGLGIDKRDIRYVLHFQGPASLEQYVQEAGRAGRDGKKANCILLYDETDRGIHEALLAKSRVRPDQLYRLGKALAAWSDENRSPSLEALALSAELGTRVASALLACMEEAGFVALADGTVRVLHPDRSIEADARSLAGQFETLRTQDGRRLDTLAQYASSTGCRAAFLCEYFGEPANEACGLCDLCQQRPSRPTSFFAPFAVPATPPRHKRSRRRGGRRRPEHPRGHPPRADHQHTGPHRGDPRRIDHQRGDRQRADHPRTGHGRPDHQRGGHARADQPGYPPAAQPVRPYADQRPGAGQPGEERRSRRRRRRRRGRRRWDGPPRTHDATADRDRPGGTPPQPVDPT